MHINSKIFRECHVWNNKEASTPSKLNYRAQRVGGNGIYRM